VAHGSRALPFFGHSPVVAIASKRVDLSSLKKRSRVNPCGWTVCDRFVVVSRWRAYTYGLGRDPAAAAPRPTQP
jgi:hypothetical protein